jgi:hypothetical protein
MHVVKFFETFSTPYFNSLKQDPIVESQKNENKNQFMQFALEVAILECSFLNHSEGILGVNSLGVFK